MSVLSVTGLLRTISGATYSSECSTYSGESQKSGSWANRPGLRDLLSEQPTNLYIFFADGVLDDFFVWVDVQVDDVGRMKAVQAFEDFFEVHRNLVLLEKGLVTGDMKDISWCLLVMKKTVLFIFIYVILPEVSKFY